MREDRTGSLLRLYPALSKIYSVKSIKEHLEYYRQEVMVKKERAMAQIQKI